MFRCLFVAGLVSVLGSSSLLAQAVPDAKAHLQDLANATSLDRPGILPWHMLVTFEVYDMAGKSEEKGTLEEWWVSDKMSKKVITSPSLRVTLLDPDRTAPLTRELFLVRALQHDIVSPMSSFTKSTDLLVDEATQRFGKVSLDCVTVSSHDTGPIGSIPIDRYCTEPSTLQLRMESTMYSEFVRNGNGKFLGAEVALDHSLAYNGRVAITGHIDKLEAWDRTKNPVDMPGTTADSGEVRPSVVFGKPLNGGSVSYPMLARDQRLTGAVILYARIGKDGKVYDMGTVATPGIVLTGAAENTLGQWTFKPYTVNGQPVDAWTTFTFNFSGNSRSR